MSDKNLKKLENEKKELQEELNFYKISHDEAEKNIKDRLNKITIIDKKIRELNIQKKFKDPEISLHALLRYIERIHNIDIEKIKKNLLSQETKEFINNFINGKITENNLTFVFKNRKIVTIIYEK